MELYFNSVETIPNLNALAVFKVDSDKVFKEDVDIVPVVIDEALSYVPWGGDNTMPYKNMNLIESDEIHATCQMFNTKSDTAAGLSATPTRAAAMSSGGRGLSACLGK